MISGSNRICENFLKLSLALCFSSHNQPQVLPPPVHLCLPCHPRERQFGRHSGQVAIRMVRIHFDGIFIAKLACVDLGDFLALMLTKTGPTIKCF